MWTDFTESSWPLTSSDPCCCLELFLVPSLCHVPRWPAQSWSSFSSSCHHLPSPYLCSQLMVSLPVSLREQKSTNTTSNHLCPNTPPLGPILSDYSRTLPQQVSSFSSSIINCSLSTGPFSLVYKPVVIFPSEKSLLTLLHPHVSLPLCSKT